MDQILNANSIRAAATNFTIADTGDTAQRTILSLIETEYRVSYLLLGGREREDGWEGGRGRGRGGGREGG